MAARRARSEKREKEEERRRARKDAAEEAGGEEAGGEEAGDGATSAAETAEEQTVREFIATMGAGGKVLSAREAALAMPPVVPRLIDCVRAGVRVPAQV